MIRVALLDSGVAERHAPRVAAACAFRLASVSAERARAGASVGGVARDEVTANGAHTALAERLAVEARAAGFEIAAEVGLGAVTRAALPHGPALADVLLEADEHIALIAARVFFESLVTSAAQLAAALDWAVEQGAALASVSAGLREDRDVLRDAVVRALARGVLVVAAAPARGGAVYPAAYAGVVRATGDARCAPGEWSWLGAAHSELGAHARAGPVQGASAGCARVAALLAAQLARGATPERALLALREGANYRGPERRSS